MTSNRAVRQLEEDVHALEWKLGRKTVVVEALKKAPDNARPKKNDVTRTVADAGRLSMKVGAITNARGLCEYDQK